MSTRGAPRQGGRNPAADAQMTANGQPVEVRIAPQPPLPTMYLLSTETRNEYLTYGVPFYQAAIRGECKKAQGIWEVYPDIVRSRITREWETGLHIAAAARNLPFVTMLVGIMTPADIALPNKIGNTALCFAAASGVVEIAKAMVNEDNGLPLVRGNEGMTPLHMAALLGHRNMVVYLLPFTVNELTTVDLMELFISLINTNLYDLALEMLNKNPTLAIARDKYKETALHVLARKSLSLKGCEDKRGIWKRLISSCSSIFVSNKSDKNTQALKLVSALWKLVLQKLDEKEISDLIRGPTPLLFVATALGNVEFITILLKSYPDLIWKVDNRKRSMFHVAVYFRQESIFKIIYQLGAIKDLIALYDDDQDNNMLHLAAKLAPANRLGIVSGAALQLQRELLWFQEVEKIVQPSYTERKNKGKLTPKELFISDHKELVKEGEVWMKNTAQSCMLVATLIATVMFAAAFTLPGGTSDNGTPNYLKKQSFLVFLISDSVSLFSSTTSILMFLSILTSRYKEEDFLHSLPTKLTLGLVTLFLSMVTMMAAFTSSMFIVFHRGSHGATIPIALMACIPVTLYALLQYDLFADIFHSTYKSRYIFESPREGQTHVFETVPTI